VFVGIRIAAKENREWGRVREGNKNAGRAGELQDKSDKCIASLSSRMCGNEGHSF